jgi:hypothetical protein
LADPKEYDGETEHMNMKNKNKMCSIPAAEGIIVAYTISIARVVLLEPDSGAFDTNIFNIGLETE